LQPVCNGEFFRGRGKPPLYFVALVAGPRYFAVILKKKKSNPLIYSRRCLWYCIRVISENAFKMEQPTNNNNYRLNGNMHHNGHMPGQNTPDASRTEGKKCFLVFKQNKYLTIPTKTIAFFYIKYDSPMIVCFDGQEYFVNFSLDQLQQLLPETQFFRLNRQYLVNFNAVKEVEHYFARKLLVKLTITAPEKLIVSKEKATKFLHWLGNR
jgi:DNA-binding LytR/AlgR family response regulator